MDQYADKLTDGTKAMLKKYPDSYRVDVYQTQRTAAAPQWVYDNTFKNATRGKLCRTRFGTFPNERLWRHSIPHPKNGAEVMWNHQAALDAAQTGIRPTNQYLITSTGERVLTSDVDLKESSPFYYKELGSPESTTRGMAAITGSSCRYEGSCNPRRRGGCRRQNFDDDKTHAWVYLTGQRRVRTLPNPCCDTPFPTAGVMCFDEL